MEPVILHIETSSHACSVALSSGTQAVTSALSTEVNDHSASLAPMIRQVLRDGHIQPSDLNAIAVSIGPGSYTGLRVGLSTVKAMCYAIGCPLLAIDTLQSLAWTTRAGLAARVDNIRVDNIYVSVLDARRQDAYMAVFDQDGTRLEDSRFLSVTKDCLDSLLKPGREIVICGEGTGKWLIFQGVAGIRILNVDCHALNLITSALDAYLRREFADLASVVPNYLKPPNITIPI